MESKTLRSARASVVALAVLPALAIAGCGTTVIDNGKLEDAIRQNVSAAGNFKVTKISCPSNVTPKAGGTLQCSLTVKSNADGSEHSGNVTVHMTDSKGHVSVAASDYHVQ